MEGKFSVYQASAGTGKTFQLVAEYLKIALCDKTINPEFQNIVALTFTNRAATEMKGRVISTLIEMSNEKKGAMFEKLKLDLNFNENILADRAQKLLKKILHRYEDFAISTLDQFFYKIIRKFPIELQIPPGFILDTDEAISLRWAIDALFRDFPANPKLLDLMKSFVAERIENDKSWNIETEIFDLAAKFLIKEKNNPRIEQIEKLEWENLSAIRNCLTKNVLSVEEEIKKQATETLDFISKSGYDHDDFYQKKKGIYGYFIKNKNPNYAEENLVNKFVSDTIFEDKWTAGKTKNAFSEIFKEKVRNYFTILNDYRKENLPYWIGAAAVLKKINTMFLLKLLDKSVREYKKEHDTLYISEFNTLISNNLRNEPAHFIYEKIGNRYQHFLLDEFQDTANIQWNNLLPLVHNAVAGGGSAFVVGDAKQSIYRWRGGNVRIMKELLLVDANEDSETIEMKNFLEKASVRHDLENNRRSRREIIDFNNKFFGFLSENIEGFAYKDVYGGLRQKDYFKDGGKVAVSFMNESENEKDSNSSLIKCLKIINGLKEGGTPYSEIVLLFRSNGGGAAAAAFMTENNIPVVSSESLLLRNNPEINFLVALLYLVLDSKDEICKMTMHQYLTTRGRNEVEETHLRQILDSNAGSPALEITMNFITFFGLKDTSAIYINYFLDSIYSQSALGNITVFGFLSWWEENAKKTSIKTPGESDAVTLMTIHNSKGLEFPVVILTFDDWEIIHHDLLLVDGKKLDEGLPLALVQSNKMLADSVFKEEWKDDSELQILDNMNLLYVACTRAIRELYLVCNKRRRSGIYEWIEKFVAQNQYYNNAGDLELEGKVDKAGNRARLPMELSLPAFQSWNNAVKIKCSETEARKNNKRKFGITLHAMLQKFNSRNDIPEILEYASQSGQWALSEKSWLEGLFEQILGHNTIGKYFVAGSKIKSESEFLYGDGRIGRPDKVVFTGSDIAVLDFKSGEKRGEHIIQVKDYMTGISQLNPLPLKGMLVYLDPFEVIEVSN